MQPRNDTLAQKLGVFYDANGVEQTLAPANFPLVAKLDQKCFSERQERIRMRDKTLTAEKKKPLSSRSVVILLNGKALGENEKTRKWTMKGIGLTMEEAARALESDLATGKFGFVSQHYCWCSVNLDAAPPIFALLFLGGVDPAYLLQDTLMNDVTRI